MDADTAVAAAKACRPIIDPIAEFPVLLTRLASAEKRQKTKGSLQPEPIPAQKPRLGRRQTFSVAANIQPDWRDGAEPYPTILEKGTVLSAAHSVSVALSRQNSGTRGSFSINRQNSGISHRGSQEQNRYSAFPDDCGSNFKGLTEAQKTNILKASQKEPKTGGRRRHTFNDGLSVKSTVQPKTASTKFSAF